MTLGSDERHVEVLLVEDNPGDVKLTKEIIKDSQYRINLGVVEDGELAMAYLRKEGEYTNSARPDLILLDLNLPKKNGTEVLADISADTDLANIPVVILTGTEAEQSLLESYDIPANRSLRKPVTLSRFDQVIRLIGLLGRAPSRMPVQVEQEIYQQRPAQQKKRSWWPFGKG